MSSDRKTCKSCGAELDEQQDWCLKCGRGTASRGSIGPGWRSATAAIAASAVLALGAAAAAYAALKEGPKPAQGAVATTPPPATPSTPAPATEGSTPTGAAPPGAETPATGSKAGESSTAVPSLPSTPSTPPKIPGAAKTPHSEGPPAGWPFGGGEGSKHAGNGQGNGNGSKGGKNGGEGKKAGNEGKQPGEGKESEATNGSKGGGKQGESGEPSIPAKKAPILLDTNAASLYNPQRLSESLFGDPSLAIDGDVATAWKASITSQRSPKVGAGLIVNLRSAHSLAELKLMTSSKKMVVRIYGTKQRKPPRTLSSAGWVKLSGREAIDKRKTAIALRHSRESFRQVLLWIVEGNVESASSTSTSTSTSSTSALIPSTTVSGSATTASSASTSAEGSSSVVSGSTTTSEEGAESSAGEASVAEIELYERASSR